MKTLSTTWLFAIVFLYISVNFNNVFAQQPQDGNGKDIFSKGNFIPPSPSVAAINKHGNWTVDMGTGLPDISITLVNLQDVKLSVPIKLNYHASGIRVSEAASWVGLGWSLNNGGVISRTVRGLPDEQSNGFYATNSILPVTSLSNMTNEQKALLEKVAYGMFDAEPDIYSFSFMGYSGKFYFDLEQKLRLMGHSDLKIYPSQDSWKIVTPEGIEGEFGGLGYTEFTVPATDSYTIATFPSAWLIKSIKSPNNETIRFFYNAYQINQGLSFSQIEYSDPDGFLECANKGSSASYNYISYRSLKLSRIESDWGIIYFDVFPFQREDLIGDHALSSIRLFSNKDQKVIKKINFNYSYSEAVGGCDIPGYTPTSFELKRLKLNSIDFINPENNISPKDTYKFSYNPISLPGRCSFSIDHWGYYNGEGNTVLYPKIEGLFNNKPFANRNANPQLMMAETLIKIDYPTGGHTDFEFEPNHRTYTFQGNTITEYFGGLRLKK